MAPVDLNKNKDTIVKAHKEVSDPKSQTNWALFGYEGQSDVLKLVSKGDGGIEELTEDLNAGKILYAYVKVIDPNTNLPKFVFINWQGEGVPEVRKGCCANHVRDVQNLLRGAHVTINARTEDDVDEELVITKVAKASGANYSFHKEEKKPMPAVEPVGSVYQKVKPQIEIKPDIREKFWERNEQEEKQRIVADRQRQQQERAKMEQETKSREEKDATAREQREKERLRKIQDIKAAEKKAASQDVSSNKAHWDADDAKRDEDERAHRSDQLRKDRAAEAKALAASRSSGARNVFEHKPSSQFDEPSREPVPVRKLKQPAFLESSNQPEPVQRKQPIQLPQEPAPAPASPSPVSSPVASVPASPSPVSSPVASVPAAAAPAAAAPEAEEPQEVMYDEVSAVEREPQPQHEPPAMALLSQGLPRRPPSDDEDEEYQNWEEENIAVSDITPSEEYNAASHITPSAAELEEYDEEEEEEDQQPMYDDAGGMRAVAGGDSEELYHDATSNKQMAANRGLCARALYDYQAEEDNEITFDPDDIIMDIDKIDDGWWVGTAPDGSRGMFPSNYVEESNY